MHEESDANLVAAARGGDTRAFATLVERHQRMVCAVTYCATGDRAMSEDLAQEAFIIAWKKLAVVENSERFAAWLCGVARNLASNARRKAGRELSTPEFESHTTAEPDATARLLAAEEEATMWRALAAMPESYREPLVLFYRQEQSTKQVAAALGLSASAVEQRLSRGRKQLRAELVELVAGGLARTATPAAGFVAAVMTGIAALPAHAALDGDDAGPGVADVGSPPLPLGPARADAATSAGKVIAMVALAAFGLGGTAIVAVELARTGRARQPEPTGVTVAPATGLPTTRASESTRLARERQRDREAAAHFARSQAPAVKAYVLSRVHEQSVAVNLGGGESELFFPSEWGLARPNHLPSVRIWRGRVVDSDGQGVPGAVVLAGDSVRKLIGDSMSAQYGTTSGRDGAFALELGTAEAVLTVALSDSQTWSVFGRLPAGRSDVVEDVAVGPTATLYGRLTRGGAVVVGRLELATGSSVDLMYMSDEAGNYEIRSIPAGIYEVAASDSALTETGATAVRATLDLKAGERIERDFELPTGSLVAFDVQPPRHADFATITFTVVVGRHQPGDPGALQAVLAPIPPRHRRVIVHGGDDLDDPAQFRDVSGGPATACIHAERFAEDPSRPTTTAYFGCRVVEVGDPGTVTPVEFTWRADPR